MKKKIIVYFTVILLVSIASCKFSEQTPISNFTYDSFEADYLASNENFIPNNFIKLEDLSQEYSSVTFPDNILFEKTNDNHQEDFWQPVNRKLAFIDKKSELLIVVTYLFTENEFETNILSMNILPKSVIDSLQTQYDKEVVPNFDFIITKDNYVILLECTPLDFEFYTGNSDYVLEQIKLFFKEFTDYLYETSSNDISIGSQS